MGSSTRNQETTVNMSISRSGDMSMSSQQHSYSESRHQLTRIPTRLPQNMDNSKKDRHKPKKEIKLSRGVATNTLSATRYKWPSEPQNRVQFVKADYLVRINVRTNGLFPLPRPIFLSDSDFYFCPIRIGIGIGTVCQCLHITVQPIKSERKSESETKYRTVSGNKPYP